MALSVVGTDGLSESGYFRAKIAQEKPIKGSSIPYSIVHATQFFEFIKSIADAATDGNRVRLAPVLIQPMAADDVASAVGRVATGSPLNGTVEVAGPEHFRLDELIRQSLSARNDPREVIADPHARYFGAELSERTLVRAMTRDSARRVSKTGSAAPYSKASQPGRAVAPSQGIRQTGDEGRLTFGRLTIRVAAEEVERRGDG